MSGGELWTEVRVRIPAEDTDRAADIATMAAPYGLYIEDYRDLEESVQAMTHAQLIDEALLARDRSQAVIHFYLRPEDNPVEAAAYLGALLTEADIAYAVETEAVAEEAWATAWKAYFQPQPVGNRLWICPSWIEEGAPSGRQLLRIDPGMAFGTGTHATTRLMLELLENGVRDGAEALDIGCGSGILMIAALLLGAGRAVGVDIDALAVRTAVDNGQQNGLTAPRYTVVEGDLVQAVSGAYDVVVSNIVADAIIALAGVVRPFLKPGGVWLASGIIDTREADVTAALAAQGFTVTGRREQGGWVALAIA